MSLSNNNISATVATTNDTSPPPHQTGLLGLIYAIFTFLTLALTWIFTLLAILLIALTTAALGAGALLLIGRMLGYKYESSKISEGKEEPLVAFVTGFVSTLIFLIGFFMYLDDVEEWSDWKCFGVSVLGSLVIWGSALLITSLGWGAVKIFRPMKGRDNVESVNDDEEHKMQGAVAEESA